MTNRRTAPASIASIVAVLACLITGCDGQRTVRDSDIEFIGLPGVQDLMSRQAERPGEAVLLFVDPRPATSFTGGHLPGARNLDISAVPVGGGRDPAIERYRNIVVYGDHPADAPARAMAKRLMSQKYKHVRLYDGGLAEWRTRGMPIDGADSAATSPEQGG